MDYTELYHHGVLGQKWGVRRYQNKDGSLTAAGKYKNAKKEYKDSVKKAAKYNMHGENGKFDSKRAIQLEQKVNKAESNLKKAKMNLEYDKSNGKMTLKLSKAIKEATYDDFYNKNVRNYENPDKLHEAAKKKAEEIIDKKSKESLHNIKMKTDPVYRNKHIRKPMDEKPHKTNHNI